MVCIIEIVCHIKRATFYIRGFIFQIIIFKIFIFISAFSCIHVHYFFKYKYVTVYCIQCYGKGNGTPLQYACLEKPMEGRAWQAAVHGVEKSWIRLSNFPFTFHRHALEREMATYSSVLAWRVPGTGEPGGLLSMGSHRVEHD